MYYSLEVTCTTLVVALDMARGHLFKAL